MSFVEPLYLLGLLAAGLPVVIHLMNRRQAVQQPFPALELLRESEKKEARSIKVRRWLLMLLRILAIALLALALAKPFFYSSEATATTERLPTSVVYVLDDSMSMSHGDWWETARREIRRDLNRRKPWDEAALLTTSQIDGPVERFEGDAERIREALDSLSPSLRRTDLTEALGAAGDVASTSQLPNQQIVVVSDFARGGFPDDAQPEQPLGAPVEPISVRESEHPANLAITELDYQQVGPANEGEWKFDVAIRNHGPDDVEGAELRLQIEGANVGTSVVDVPTGEVVRQTIRHTETGTGLRRGRVELVGADSLEADDRRYFTFQMRSKVRALLVNGAPSSVAQRDELFFGARALEPGDGAESDVVPSTISPDGLEDADFGEYDVVLLANVASIPTSVAPDLEEFVEGGGGLFVAVGGQVEPDSYNQRLEALLPRPLRRVKRLATRDDPDAPVKVTRFGSTLRDHPVFRIFDLPGGESLQSAKVYKYMLLEPSPPEQSTVLLSYKDGAPALLERQVDNGRVFLMTTTIDNDWTDLPFQTAYLPLIRRSMLYLARRATSTDNRTHLVGSSVELEVAGRVDDRAVVDGPDDTRHVLTPTDGQVSLRPEHPGSYVVWADEKSEETDDPANRLDELAFAVNVDTAESDLRRLDDETLEPWLKGKSEEGSDQQEASNRERRRVNIWPTLLFAVTLALLAETLIGTRRSVLKRIGRRLMFRDDPEIDV